MMVLPAAFLLAMAFATSVLSGIFGAAGGLVLMGALAIVLPVQAAFVTHGVIQGVSNGCRVVLHRRHVHWDIVGVYAAGAVAASVVVWAISFTPSKPLVFLMLGLAPALTWMPKRWVRLDASDPRQGLIAGAITTAMNLVAGVSGPLTDIFFVRTQLSRHAIVATKAATQTLAHLAKIGVYGAPLLAGEAVDGLPPAWVFALAIPLSMIGNLVGGRVLERISDDGFRRYIRWIVTGVGAFYLVQAALAAIRP